MGLTDAERREPYAGFEDAIHRGRAIRAGADPDKMIDERLRQVRRWAAAWKRAASKFRAWQADTEAALERVSELKQRVAELKAENERLRDEVDATETRP